MNQNVFLKETTAVAIKAIMMIITMVRWSWRRLWRQGTPPELPTSPALIHEGVVAQLLDVAPETVGTLRALGLFKAVQIGVDTYGYDVAGVLAALEKGKAAARAAQVEEYHGELVPEKKIVVALNATTEAFRGLVRLGLLPIDIEPPQKRRYRLGPILRLVRGWKS
jgi:hypothetical protein